MSYTHQATIVVLRCYAVYDRAQNLCPVVNNVRNVQTSLLASRGPSHPELQIDNQDTGVNN